MDITKYYLDEYEKIMQFQKTSQETSSDIPSWKMTLHEINADGFKEMFRGQEIAVIPHFWPNQNVPWKTMHSHDFFEFIYIARGQCKSIVDSSEFLLKEGELCLLNTHAKHALALCNPGKDVVYNILVKKSIMEHAQFRLFSSSEFISDFFLEAIQVKQNVNNYVIFHRNGSEGLYEYFAQRIIFEYYENMLYQNQMYDFLLYALLVDLVRSYEKQINVESRQELHNQDISEMLQFMEAHWDTVNLSMIAEKFNYHPKSVTRLLKKYTGRNFSDLLAGIRLKKAQLLLTETELPIVDIMVQTGFTNRSRFNHSFQEKYHMTPSEYRKKSKHFVEHCL